MKGIRKLIKRFIKMYPEYEAWFDEIDSYPGYYVIAITEPVLKLTCRYIFTSCRDFKEWMDGVVLE